MHAPSLVTTGGIRVSGVTRYAADGSRLRRDDSTRVSNVVNLSDIGKRLLLGRKLRSTQLGETLLPKRIALPVFASDALSSVAYAPDEILLTLSLAGLAAYAYSWKIAILVAIVMLVVVASYRQNVHAYPSGGGDYEVATVNLGSERGPDRGQRAAGRLRADRRGVDLLRRRRTPSRCCPILDGHEALVAAGAALILMALNLRGVRESGTFFADPDLLLHVRHPRHGGLRAVPDLRARRADRRRHSAQYGIELGPAATRRSPASRWSPCWPGRSRPAAPR